MMIRSIEWLGDSVKYIDQTKLPLDEVYIKTSDYRDIAGAIRKLEIRGAPLIGIAAAYGVALSAIESRKSEISQFVNEINKAVDLLASTRPTAVNLFWALKRMKAILNLNRDIEIVRRALIDEAITIHSEDIKMCKEIGEHGSTLIPDNATILTHCNTGALATGGDGTAQSVITTAHSQGKRINVFADETRPLLQGARLTVWELMKHGIDVKLITDNVAPYLMQRNKITLAITGADRIAVNGDVANKIGTYSIAVNAKHHGIPFYIAAPTSTIDVSIKSGSEISIEERNIEEVTLINGRRIVPNGVKVYSPAFDVTPASLVTAIITDRGLFYPPFDFSK
ncbi:MAG: S-methyl-5-thioribose-1-phosphate isomerase [Ignavibacteriales bacterium]|nr:S-methyl-5-thioribose-1-phosphate isomerase [Ignavibacteriales bacterium]